LRQRVMDGEVDLERLGIKRLTVPRALLEKMPLYTYPPANLLDERGPEGAGRCENEKSSESNPDDGLQTKEQAERLALQQCCVICMDDFIPGHSVIRELPCHDVFHASCVDEYLRENSSLCPLCKRTVLPKGYCPQVLTSNMVRKERRVRQMRQRLPQEDSRSGPSGYWKSSGWRYLITAPSRKLGRGSARQPRQHVTGDAVLSLPPAMEAESETDVPHRRSASPSAGTGARTGISAG
jgi:hypothetical protein